MDEKKFRFDILLIYLITIIMSSLYILFNFTGLNDPFKIITADICVFSGLIYECLKLKEEKAGGNKIKGLLNSIIICAYILTVMYDRYLMILPIVQGILRDYLFWAGTAVFIPALLLRILARHALKNDFSYSIGINSRHQLVSSGIYSIVRHPAYLGTLLSMLGIALLFGSFTGMILMVIYLPFGLIRIRREEEILIKEFGNKYLKYQKEVKMIIPFLY